MDGALSTRPSKTRSVRLEDIGAQLEVRRHPGARRLTLRVSRTRRAVIVTLPLQCDLDEAGTFLNRHIDWVRARLDSLPNHVPFEARSGDAAARRAAYDRVHRMHALHASSRSISANGNRPPILVPGAKDLAPNRMFAWLFDEAQRDLEQASRTTRACCR